jgi:hypothetical protein
MGYGNELNPVEPEFKQTIKNGVKIAGINMLSLASSIVLSLILTFRLLNLLDRVTIS